MTINSPTRLDILAMRKLWQEAFGDGDAFLDSFFDTAYSPERARVARLDDAIIGVLYWFDCQYDNNKIAYVYAVATAKAQRGKGVCTSLMKNTHAHLKSLGYEGAILVPGSQALFEFYEKIGYKTCSSVSEIRVAAGVAPCAIRKIDKAEYLSLRRKYLPVGGVVQEGACLDFLETYATLYSGDDFLLAAYKGDNALFGVELLGNTTSERAASITCALDARLARFRTPGEDKPFAMYYPLCDNYSLTPKYFGLAFD